jgi:hypothetical protein
MDYSGPKYKVSFWWAVGLTLFDELLIWLNDYFGWNLPTFGLAEMFVIVYLAVWFIYWLTELVNINKREEFISPLRVGEGAYRSEKYGWIISYPKNWAIKGQEDCLSDYGLCFCADKNALASMDYRGSIQVLMVENVLSARLIDELTKQLAVNWRTSEMKTNSGLSGRLIQGVTREGNNETGEWQAEGIEKMMIVFPMGKEQSILFVSSEVANKEVDKVLREMAQSLVLRK